MSYVRCYLFFVYRANPMRTSTLRHPPVYLLIALFIGPAPLSRCNTTFRNAKLLYSYVLRGRLSYRKTGKFSDGLFLNYYFLLLCENLQKWVALIYKFPGRKISSIRPSTCTIRTISVGIKYVSPSTNRICQWSFTRSDLISTVNTLKRLVVPV